jgi:hypothetical protein
MAVTNPPPLAGVTLRSQSFIGGAFVNAASGKRVEHAILSRNMPSFDG